MRKVRYYSGNPSPIEYIDALPHDEAANIDLKLEMMCEIPIHEWMGVEHIAGKLWKLRSGDHRFFYFLFKGDIVILHAVRKSGMKLKQRDIDLAQKRIELIRGT